MSDFRLWATVNKTAAHEFAVCVRAVPESADEMHRAHVEMQVTTTLEVAETMRASMLLAMGERVRARGDRVVDVEEWVARRGFVVSGAHLG